MNERDSEFFKRLARCMSEQRQLEQVEVNFLFDLAEAQSWGKAELELNHKRMAHIAGELVINHQCRPVNRADCELN